MTYTFIQMPEKLIVDESNYSETFGRFILQPLEKGYGVTLGNSIRRVLLSSIPGAAIIGIKVEGVVHEFTSIPGMVEDVAEFVLNLKEVRLKPATEGISKAVVSLRGPAEFKAGDLQNGTDSFTVLNPDLHLATLNEDCNTTMEISVGTGIGYLPAEEIDKSDFSEDMIPIDAVYSPVKNVRHYIEQTRVGQRTDYEKLILEIETDGSITPVEAVKQAARVLRDHLHYFSTVSPGARFGDELEELDLDPEATRVRKILQMRIDEIELSVRSHNCLKAAGIHTIGELVRKTEQELLNYRNFGQKSLNELSDLIKGYGLHFGMDVDKYLVPRN